MADASDSKSDAGNSVWVQVPSPALTQKSRKHAIFIEKSKVYGFFFLMTASTAATSAIRWQVFFVGGRFKMNFSVAFSSMPCTSFGAYSINFVLDTVLLPHKQFCVTHQCGK